MTMLYSHARASRRTLVLEFVRPRGRPSLCIAAALAACLGFGTTAARAEPDAETAPRALHYRLQTGDPGGPEVDRGARSVEPVRGAARAAEAGLFLPFTLTPRGDAARAMAFGVAGYDSASQSFQARSATEAAITDFLSVRVEFEHGPGTGVDDRVGFGARAQILNAAHHGIDVGAGFFYQPKDFRSEGNLVGALSVGRRFGALALLGTALFGSDPEGDDQDAEGRAALLYSLGPRLQLGWDSRFHTILSSDVKRYGTTMLDWECAFMPLASMSLGPIALLTEAGLSGRQETGPIGKPNEASALHWGVLALAGAGAAF